jgi:hypothetical protein
MYSDGNGAQPEQVFLSGYTLDRRGLRMWPLRKVAHDWTDLQSLSLETGFYRRHILRLVLVFEQRKRAIRVNCGSGAKALRKTATVLRWIGARATACRGLDAGPLETLQSAEANCPPQLLKSGQPTAGERLMRARFWLAALEPDKALHEVRKLHVSEDSISRQAVAVGAEALVLKQDVDAALVTIDTELSARPDNHAVAVLGAMILLARDDTRGLALAEHALGQPASDATSTFAALAEFRIRRRKWSEALTILDRWQQSPTSCAEPAVRESIATARADIARMAADKRVAFRRLDLVPLLRRAGSLVLLVVSLALLLLPLVTVGPTFWHEGRKLAALRQRGVRAAPENVELRSETSIDTTMLASIQYAYSATSEPAEPWAPSFPETHDRKAFDAYMTSLDRRIGGELPRGWHIGQSIVFEWTARSITADKELRFVTFLREDPSVSAIGAITNTRIWLTWIGSGQGLVSSVVFLAVLAYLAARAVQRRAAKEPARSSFFRETPNPS